MAWPHFDADWPEVAEQPFGGMRSAARARHSAMRAAWTRFLYWFYFIDRPYKAVSELYLLPPEERLKVIIAAKQSAFWDQSNDMRTFFWAFVGPPLYVGIYYLFKWIGHPGLGWLFGGALFVVALRDMAKQDAKIFHPHIRKILKARADAAATGTTGSGATA